MGSLLLRLLALAWLSACGVSAPVCSDQRPRFGSLLVMLHRRRYYHRRRHHCPRDPPTPQEPAAGTTVRLNEFSDGFLTVRVALSFSRGEAATDAPATAALSCPDGAPGGEWLCVRLNGTLVGCLPYENRGQDDIEAEKEVTVGVPREQLRVGRSWIMLQVVRTTTDEARADFEAGRFDLDSGGVARSSASGVVVAASMRPSYVDVVGGAHGDGGGMDFF